MLTTRGDFGQFMRLPVVYLSAPTDRTSGGSGGAGGNGEDDGAGDDDNAGGGGDTSGAKPSGEDDDPPAAVFRTTAELNQRLARAKRSGLDEEAQKLGYKDHKEMLAAAAEYRKKQADEQTELDREKSRRAELEQELEREREANREARLAARVERLCTTDDKKVREKFDKIVDPEIALHMLDRSEIVFNDDGSIEGVEDALKALLEERPHLRMTPEKPTNSIRATPKGTEEGEESQGKSFIRGYINQRYTTRS